LGVPSKARAVVGGQTESNAVGGGDGVFLDGGSVDDLDQKWAEEQRGLGRQTRGYSTKQSALLGVPSKARAVVGGQTENDAVGGGDGVFLDGGNVDDLDQKWAEKQRGLGRQTRGYSSKQSALLGVPSKARAVVGGQTETSDVVGGGDGVFLDPFGGSDDSGSDTEGQAALDQDGLGRQMRGYSSKQSALLGVPSKARAVVGGQTESNALGGGDGVFLDGGNVDDLDQKWAEEQRGLGRQTRGYSTKQSALLGVPSKARAVVGGETENDAVGGGDGVFLDGGNVDDWEEERRASMATRRYSTKESALLGVPSKARAVVGGETGLGGEGDVVSGGGDMGGLEQKWEEERRASMATRRYSTKESALLGVPSKARAVVGGETGSAAQGFDSKGSEPRGLKGPTSGQRTSSGHQRRFSCKQSALMGVASKARALVGTVSCRGSTTDAATRAAPARALATFDELPPPSAAQPGRQLLSRDWSESTSTVNPLEALGLDGVGETRSPWGRVRQSDLSVGGSVGGGGRRGTMSSKEASMKKMGASKKSLILGVPEKARVLVGD
jgi:uncharacterized protein YegP (UPF0339 family)